MEKDLQGDERYAITDKNNGIIHKVVIDDGKAIPNKDGQEYNIIEEQEKGYTVYITPQDPSQPNPQYYISKKYFVEI